MLNVPRASYEAAHQPHPGITVRSNRKIDSTSRTPPAEFGSAARNAPNDLANTCTPSDNRASACP
jgi:hypothetical protein